jgi:hypothetical protein
MATVSLVPFGASSTSTCPNDGQPTKGIETPFTGRVAVDWPYAGAQPHSTEATAPVVLTKNPHAKPLAMDEGYYSVATTRNRHGSVVQLVYLLKKHHTSVEDATSA